MSRRAAVMLKLLLVSTAAAVRLIRNPPPLSGHPTHVRVICSSVMPDHLVALQAGLSSGSAQLFDVRERFEWRQGRLQQAESVPLSELVLGKSPIHEKSKPTYVYCRSGHRSPVAASILMRMGYDDVIPLEEGYSTLLQMGFPRAR